ncbi:hypothetical protein RND81_04G099800 [Saponaria officinalis]|uniref:Glycine-rich protein n=1 Tax=Saponaria officinalis TaxID=3572 RepID=A0AAW1LDH1_SAPOF
MAKLCNVLGLVLLVIFSSHLAFAARNMQFNNKNNINNNENENVIYATKETPSVDHAKGVKDNKNLIYGGVGSFGGVGGGAGIVGPLGGVGFGSGVGVGSGIGGVGFLPAGGIGGVGAGVGGGGVGGVGGGLGGIAP